MFNKISIKNVRQALDDIKDIERPDGDNEGYSINSPAVYNYLSFDDQEKVDKVVEIISDYVRQSDGQPNNRAITELKKNGFQAYLNQDQYDPYRYVGIVRMDEWDIDISDPS